MPASRPHAQISSQEVGANSSGQWPVTWSVTACQEMFTGADTGSFNAPYQHESGLNAGALMAPTLREECRAGGERFAVLAFIIETEKKAVPAWAGVERVLWMKRTSAGPSFWALAASMANRLALVGTVTS